MRRFVQPKLTLGPVDDPFEREADQVAERVVRRAPGPLGLSRIGSGSIQRCDEVDDDCDACMGMGGEKRKAEEDPNQDLEVEVGDDEAEQNHNKRIKVNLKALPTASAPATESSAASTVEAGIEQARGRGRPLPPPIREPMERAFRTDFNLVRVHSGHASDRLNRSLSARAFTTGRDIFFRHGEYRPDSHAGRRLLAHELAHVVQQGAAGKERLQRKFVGPQLHNAKKAKSADKVYPGHGFKMLQGAQANTGCGTENRIRTAGEKLNAKKSIPGDPINFTDYRNGYSIKPGLVKDKNRNCASTRMHLINHRLENSANTQGNPNNIFLGTKNSNNPTHLSQVENPVIAALGHASQKNDLYETAMKTAETTKDSASGKKALFWDQADEPDDDAVDNYQKVYLIEGKLDKGFRAAKKKGDQEGFGLITEGYVPAPGYRHLWLEYTVRANYANRPPHIGDNIDREKKANTDKKGQVISKALAKKIKNFDDHWADNAFPPDFTCNATYYTATYRAWGKDESYRVESEKALTIKADL